MKRNPGRNLETGTEAKSMEDCSYWLVLHNLFSLLPYPPGPLSHGCHQPLLGWALPHEHESRNAPTDLSSGLSDGDRTFSIEGSLFPEDYYLYQAGGKKPTNQHSYPFHPVFALQDLP